MGLEERFINSDLMKSCAIAIHGVEHGRLLRPQETLSVKPRTHQVSQRRFCRLVETTVGPTYPRRFSFKRSRLSGASLQSRKMPRGVPLCPPTTKAISRPSGRPTWTQIHPSTFSTESPFRVAV